MFRSLDNGESWTQVNNGLTYYSYVTSLAVNSSDDVFAGIFVGDEGGVFRSVDNGENWTQVNNGLTNLRVVKLVVNSADVLFVITYNGGFFRSVNNGETWTQVNTGPTLFSVSALIVNSSDDLFISDYESIYRSVDSGENWTEINSGLTGTGSHIQTLAVNSSDDLFAGTSDSGVFRSVDNGDNWIQVNNGLSSLNISSLTVNSADNLFAGIMGGGFFRSLDNGETWIQVNSDTLEFYVNTLSVNSSNILFAGTDGDGIFRSMDNGENWTQINNGLIAPEVNSLAVNSSDDLFAGTFGSGVFRSMDNGQNWEAVNKGLTARLFTTLVINSSDVFFAGSRSGIFRSVDNGDNWTAVNNGLTEIDVFSIAVNSSDDLFAGTSGGGIFRSIDNGESWTEVNNGLTIYYVHYLVVNSSDDLFAGTINGIFRSVDNGENWTQVNNGLTDHYVSSIAVNSSDDLFVGTSNSGIFRSIDNGESWTEVNNGLTNPCILTLAVNSSDVIFAETWDGGVFRSVDNCENWIEFNEGLTNFYVSTFTVNSSGHIFAGTFRGGVFRYENYKPEIVSDGFVKIRENSFFEYTPEFLDPDGPDTVVSFPAPRPSWTLIDGASIKGILPEGAQDSSFLVVIFDGIDIDTFKIDIFAQQAVSYASLPGFRTGAWQMIGFPCELSPKNLGSVIGDDMPRPPGKTSWKLSRYNSEDSAYKVYALNDPLVAMEGYWLWSFDSVAIDFAGYKTVPDTSIGNNYYMSTRLKPGWNQVSVPFNSSIPWNVIIASDSIQRVAWSYVSGYGADSRYDTVSVLEPFTGYWVKNDAQTDGFLLFPYYNGSYKAASPSSKSSLSPRDTWSLMFKLQSGRTIDQTNIIGFREGALSGPDNYDFEEPPHPPGRYVLMSFVCQTGLNRERYLAGNYLPVEDLSDGCIFDVLFQGNTEEPSFLELKQPSNIPESFSVYLKDPVTDKLYLLNAGEPMVIPEILTPQGIRYQLLVGSQDYIEEKELTIEQMPDDFTLFQNYPNPFNLSTTIQFDLPIPQEVTIEIINILGQEVRLLWDGSISAGRHTVIWDGRDDNGRVVTSGVYFFRLYNSSLNSTRKMVLLK